jgi:TPR repeat protein
LPINNPLSPSSKAVSLPVLRSSKPWGEDGSKKAKRWIDSAMSLESKAPILNDIQAGIMKNLSSFFVSLCFMVGLSACAETAKREQSPPSTPVATKPALSASGGNAAQVHAPQSTATSNDEPLAQLRLRAEKGDPLAQYTLGTRYAKGQGVPQDYVQAIAWYRKAAEQGLADAQNDLGALYAQGLGVPRDYAQAVSWYRKAAEQGHAIAQYNLGVMYANGQGVAQDDAEAAAWYRKAAEQGDAVAQYSLGKLYAKGKGVARDDAQAALWYRKAAELGYAAAQNELGVMYQNGRGVRQDYAKAIILYRKAAEQGYAKAQYNLGAMYEKKLGVPASKVIAYALYDLAAATDPNDQNAINARQAISNQMSPEEILEGKKLAQRLAEPGNFLKALDDATKKAKEGTKGNVGKGKHHQKQKL